MYLLNGCYFCRLMLQGANFFFPLLSRQEHLLCPLHTHSLLVSVLEVRPLPLLSKPQEQEWCRFAEGMTAGTKVMCLFLASSLSPSSR